jgi:transcriptional regulator with PAS, ATPase and Fis domain
MEPERELGGFREIDVGWFGGAGLRAATDPVRQLPADLPVIIQGETGTGKEGMARFVHRCSGRRGELVAVNCAALPAELAEAEFFGYRKGAFTGAQESSPGLFRAADGGTLFLDEILDLPLGLQAKLLRVIESKVVRGLGETKDVPIDVRLVAATQDSLATAVNERRFRADLLARLDGVTVVLPPLRKRREDIVPLFLNFARASGREKLPDFEPKLIEALCLFDWPMNVRQLFQQARRLVAVHGQEALLRRSHLPDWMLMSGDGSPDASGGANAGPGAAQGIVAEVAGVPSTGPVSAGARSGTPGRRKTDDEAEFEALMIALRENDGSVAQAATALGISRQRAYRVLGARPGFNLDDVRKPS